MTKMISVGIMGFSPQEENKLKKIFELSQQHERRYKLGNIADTQPVELLIVKKENELVQKQQQAYQARYKSRSIPVVVAGRDPAINEDPYYIRGVLIPSRVFAVLDKIEIPPETKTFATHTEESFIRATTDAADEAETIAENALHVLVVDDSAMMQKSIEMELKKTTLPLATDFANTGEEALEKVKQKKYDFIFLDVMMPGIDGFETCTQIRKVEGMAKTPVIMLTSKTSALDEVKGLMAGCTTYLTKPFAHDEFHSMLERIVHWVKEFNDRK